MAKSRMQDIKECYLCRKAAEAAGYVGELTDKGLHRHHVIFGRGYRKKSEKFGLWVYLCVDHHTKGKDSVHKNKAVNVELRQQAERIFLQDHSFEEWMETFTRNYLDEIEINRISTKEEGYSEERKAENNSDSEDSTCKNRTSTKEEPPPGFWFIE